LYLKVGVNSHVVTKPVQSVIHLYMFIAGKYTSMQWKGNVTQNILDSAKNSA